MQRSNANAGRLGDRGNLIQSRPIDHTKFQRIARRDINRHAIDLPCVILGELSREVKSKIDSRYDLSRGETIDVLEEEVFGGAERKKYSVNPSLEECCELLDSVRKLREANLERNVHRF